MFTPAIAVLLVASLLPAPARAQAPADYLVVLECASADVFAYDPSTKLLSTGARCVEWTGSQDAGQDPNTFLSACNASSPLQQWLLDEQSTVRTLSAAQSPASCVNVQGFGTDPGHEVWTCECSGCQDNCLWQWRQLKDGGPGKLVNPASGLCLSAPGPPLPPTCAAGSVAANLSFCDSSLSHIERARSLVALLTLDEKLQLWSPSFPTLFIPRLNVKSYMWDATCIHGPAPYHLSPAPRVTVTAHAINLGATFDLQLLAAVSNLTSVEMRAVTQQFYARTAGRGVLALGCDGGPLANSAHDPRWGRISETYGEDPYLISRMGSVATVNMQQPTAAGGQTYIMTSQTTRHFLGYHMSNLMPLPAMNVTLRDLYDHYLPAYEALQAPGLSWTGDQGGRAEAIMCSYAAVNGVPSCASRDLLQAHLRAEWQSDALVQSDCCDSITSIWNIHHYARDLADAVVLAVTAGTQLQYGTDNVAGRQAFMQALQDGRLNETQLDDSVTRILLTRFRLGEFDEDGPFGSVGGTNWLPFLDSDAHREVARETASASIVLLRNQGNLLPLPAQQLRSVAVVGPFANALDEFLHSYNGVPSRIVNPLAAVQEVFNGTATTVAFEEGTGILANSSSSSIAAACRAAAAADVTIAVLGLGTPVEQESLDRGEGHGSIVGLGFPPVQEDLLSALRTATPRLVLVVVSGGGVAVAAERADAIVWAGYGGEEAGHGLVDVLFGAVSPSGRLPQTIYAPNYLSQVGPELDYSTTSGVGRTYRYLSVPPLYAFGFGLSYTTFRYSNLTLDFSDVPNIWVSASLANTGAVTSATITQLYVSVPTVPGLPTPKWALQGFRKDRLAPGQACSVALRLVPAQWSTVYADGTRHATTGRYTVYIGGGQPDDAQAAAVSNVLAASFVVGPGGVAEAD